MLNIEFQPIVSDRNYAPTRTFVTKWDVEIENNRTKKISRRRERDTKYFQDFDQHSDSLPPIVILSEYDENYNGGWELESDDGEGEETRQGWLRSVAAENAYYDRKYGELKGNFDWYDMNQPELDTDQGAPRKRFMDEFDWEQGLFKRSRV
jgi:hypothetical protein